MHAFRRDDALRRLADESFDVLVIGGGVTGAGVALDAASRGLKTALVEKSDFASGTSSKSSKMVHGGLRYLQQREIRLVYENLAERQRLLDNAPHLVAPLPFLIPLFGRDGVVSKTLARSYSSALWMYDLTGGWRIGERHHEVSRQEALEHLPTLNTDHLVAGFLYFDARADDARLTLTLARTAAIEYGAAVANYTPVVQLGTSAGAAGGARGARVQPDPTDPSSAFDIRARVVVNATGVWADDVRSLDEGTHPKSIRPAKGVHMTVPADRLPCDIAAVIPVPKDKRSIFVVPWPGTDLVYLGTTDTDYTGPLDDPACTPEDVDYLIEAANNITTSRLTRADVTGVWAGLRPLLAPGAGHVSERTADLSRRHTVMTSSDGVVTVTGGKLTTYRKMAQDTVDAVVRELGESPRRRRCVTKHLPLLGATTKTRDPVSMAQPHARLLNRYGSESPHVLALGEDRPELLEPAVAGLPYTRAELVYAAREEMAQTLDDVLSRRTRAMIQRAQPTMAAAPALAELLAADMGWSASEAAEQAARFTESCEKELLTAGLDLP
ncbi:MAG TPA: glycerol-3-phosphate dehydrogenase/oxidase [Acidimicrobiales bacterium]|nr:glycerol-3-phosphate dehydrogenase/oxidase [Acidimicrobiales bacterium]